MRVPHLAMHLEGHLAELDINPLMVLPSGQGVKAVDALVVLRPVGLDVAECRTQNGIYGDSLPNSRGEAAHTDVVHIRQTVTVMLDHLAARSPDPCRALRRSAIFFLSFINSLRLVGMAKVGVGNCFSSSNTDSSLLNRLKASS